MGMFDGIPGLEDVEKEARRAIGGEGAKRATDQLSGAFDGLLGNISSIFTGETEVKDMSPEDRQALQQALNMTAGYRGPMNGADDARTLGLMREAVQRYADQHPNPDASEPVRTVDNNSDIAIDNDILKQIVGDANERAMNGQTPQVDVPARSGRGR